MAAMAVVARAQSVCASICLVSSVLPSATVNTPYSTALSNVTTGGVPPYTYSSPVLPSGLGMNSAGLITGTPTQVNLAGAAGSVTITDSSNPPQIVTGVPLTIVVFPQPLTIMTSTLPLGIQGAAYNQPLQATGGVPPYSWSLFRSSLAGTGLEVGSTGNVTGTPASSGTISFKVEATDQQQNQAFQTLTLQVNPQLAITTAPALHFALSGQPYSVQFATQPGTGAPGTITWSAAPNTLPQGLTLDPTGLLHGSPAFAGSYSFTIQASDGVLPAQINATLKVYGPLSITTLQLPTATVQQSYGPVGITATGGSGSFGWSASGLPSNLGINAGVIGGTPGASGSFPVTISVYDLVTGQSASQSYTLVVGYPTLSITAPAPIGIAAGGSVSVTLAATGGLQPYSWSGAGALPSGFALTSGGLLTGMPAQPGNLGIAVQVTDSEVPPVTATATVNVNVLGFTNTSPLPPGTTTATYSATFKAVGGTGSYTFSASGLPTGLSLSNAGLLSGLVKQPGTYTFSVQVTDTTPITASATYSLTINIAGPLSVTAPSLPSGTVQTPYSASLNTAALGGSPPYQWSVQGGTLPPGLSLSATGVLSGTPSAPPITTGQNTYSFTIGVTDAAGATASTSATVQIDPPALAVTTQSPLASGIVNVPYPQQVLTATGGTPPYTFSLAGGSLPNGMSLTGGTIGGTPTTAGDFSVTVVVEDSTGAEAQTSLSGTIRAAATDLVLSTGTLSFTLSAGGSTLPPSQNFSIASSTVGQTIAFSAQVGPSWLSLSGGSGTPASLVVSLTSQALSLAPSSTPYTATITVTCNVSTPCAGNSQTVSVTLLVSTGPAVLNAVTNLLSFSTTSLPAAASSQTLTIQNTGGSPLSFASIGCEASWCTVGSVPMFVYAGESIPLNVTADPTGLNPGFYRTTVDISSSGGFASIPVTFLIAQSSELVLAPSGAQFEMPAGGSPGNPNGSFLVSVAGSATVNWTAAVTSSNSSWLILNSTAGSASGSAPGTVNFSIDPTMTAGLAAQPWYATIEVTAPNTINSPQDFQVILNVMPAANPLYPDPEPAGLVFLTEASATPLPQIVQVFASSATPVGYQASANTNDGAQWLSVSPLTGTTSTSAVPESEVSVDPTNLAPGVYYGGVNYSLSSATVRTVNVMLIVTPQVAAPSPSSVHPNATAPPACTPSALAPAQTGLVDNFSTPASWPTPLSILLLDDCGNAIPNGQIAVTFTNGDPPLALGLANRSTGLYSGTWTPGNASSQVSLTARAIAPGFSAATLRIAGQVVPNTAPVLNKSGTVNGFNPQVGDALAPGTIVQINGSGLASAAIQASSIPLPTNLNQTQILIGGIPAPLFYASPSQVIAQVPLELNPNNQYQVIASANGALTSPITIQLAPVTPGFAVNPDGTLTAQHGDGSAVTSASPAQPGEEVATYLLGLGSTNSPIPDGAGAPFNPLAVTAVTPTVTLNGTSASVLFAGLTPGLVGLYQVNFQIPPGTPNGNAIVVLTQGSFTSNSAIIPVQSMVSPSIEAHR